jgi:hypothetical protein
MSSKYFIWIVHVSMCFWKFSGNFCDFLSIFRALKHFLGYLENVFALKIKFRKKNPFFLVGPSPSSEVCLCPFISFAGRSPTQARTSPDPSPPAKPIWPWRAPLGLGAIGVRAQETCAAPYKARRPRPPPAPRRRPAYAPCEAPRRLLPEPPCAPPPRLKTNRRRHPPIPAGPVVLRPR